MKPKLIVLSRMDAPGIGLEIPQSSPQVVWGKWSSMVTDLLWFGGAFIKMELILQYKSTEY